MFLSSTNLRTRGPIGYRLSLPLVDFKPHIWAVICSSTRTVTAPLHSFNTMSIDPSPELKLLFEAALNEFENRTGTNLVQHQVVDKLVNCQSADSVIDVLQEQAQAFHNFRGDDGRVMTWLKQTVDVLDSLSTSGVLGEGIGLVCIYSFHLTRMASPKHTFSSAIPTSKSNLCWNRYTSRSMCPNLLYSSKSL
jgi:hypothetical protein